MSQKIIHGDNPFRGSEVIQLDVAMGIKHWIIHKTLLISPSIPLLSGYFIYKWLTLFSLMAKNESIDDFVWIDNTFLVIIVVSIIAIFLFGKKLADKWQEKAVEAHKRLVSDEYIRGSKLVCIDEFNSQFNQDDEMIVLEVENEICNREF